MPGVSSQCMSSLYIPFFSNIEFGGWGCGVVVATTLGQVVLKICIEYMSSELLSIAFAFDNQACILLCWIVSFLQEFSDIIMGCLIY